jgi:epoxyqueuosine reductase
LLGTVLTTAELPVDKPATDRCGTCRRCIDACPTGAITEPYKMDATRCISYLTIETAGEIASPLKEQMGNWLYGCDICQDVCPWNREVPTSLLPEFQPRFLNGAIDIPKMLEWDDDSCRIAIRRSAMKRIKLPILRRNAEIVRENLSKH